MKIIPQNHAPCTSWLGHKFKSLVTMSTPVEPERLNGWKFSSDWALIEIINSLTIRAYTVICTRCGMKGE